jgi:hypothetical protein
VLGKCSIYLGHHPSLDLMGIRSGFAVCQGRESKGDSTRVVIRLVSLDLDDEA